ncbi:unnamed protein product [Caenorhabditis brenneri]
MDTTTSFYDHATLLFPNADESSRVKFYQLMLTLEKFARPSLQFQYYLSFFGIVLTILHLIVLTRKAMMMSSIITIMIGIGICDLIAMISTIESSGMFFDEEGTDCTPPVTLLSYKVFWVFVVIRDFVRRSSTWLGVMMALVRFMVIKFGTSMRFQKFSKPISGFFVIWGCFILSSGLSLIYYFRYDIIEKGVWQPMSYCKDIPLTSRYTVYTQRRSELYTSNNEVFGKTYMLVNGIVSKIIPCILLPILTFILVLELRRAEAMRKSSNFSKRISSEKTTGLVIFMAVSFFILELPIGISWVFQVSYTDFGFLYLATYVSHMCNSIFIINATTHSVVCFLMSSQYRVTVAALLRLKNDQTTSVNSTQLSKVGK